MKTIGDIIIEIVENAKATDKKLPNLRMDLVHLVAQSYANQAVQRRDKEIINELERFALLTEKKLGRCAYSVSRRDLISHLSQFLSTSSHLVEPSSEPDQPSILEEVKRLRDEYAKLAEETSEWYKKRGIDKSLSPIDAYFTIAEELTEIINKHQ